MALALALVYSSRVPITFSHNVVLPWIMPTLVTCFRIIFHDNSTHQMIEKYDLTAVCLRELKIQVRFRVRVDVINYVK